MERSSTLAEILPGIRSQSVGEDSAERNLSLDEFDEDETILNFAPKIKPKDKQQLIFCRFSKNIFKHMTLQGEKPKGFDLMAQVFHIYRTQQSSLNQAEYVRWSTKNRQMLWV